MKLKSMDIILLKAISQKFPLSIKGGGLKNLPGFRLIRFSCIQKKTEQTESYWTKPRQIF